MVKDIKGQVRRITINSPEDLYKKFQYICYEEGYSMQKVLLLLMKYYVEDSIGKYQK